MALPTFQWGAGGQAITTPEQAARRRSVAESLMAQSATPGRNWAEGLADVAAALSGANLENRVTDAETAGRERAGGLFANLAVNSTPDSIIAALTSPDSAWASPAQTSIASALLQSGLERADPMYQLQLQTAQAQLDQLRNPQPESTNSISNYEYLVRNGVDPAAAQGMAFGGGGTTVNNLGNIPSGYEVFQDPTTGATQMRPIAGGPADQAARAAQEASVTDRRQTERYGNVVTEDIGRALDLIEADPAFTTGVIGQALSQIGGTPANRVANLIETVESNVGFDRLQAMRESSPTGGALGSVTERELSLLTSSIGALKQSNNDQDLAYNLRRVNKIYMDIIHGPGNWDSDTPNAPTEAPGWQDLGNGIRVRPIGQ